MQYNFVSIINTNRKYSLKIKKTLQIGYKYIWLYFCQTHKGDKILIL